MPYDTNNIRGNDTLGPMSQSAWARQGHAESQGGLPRTSSGERSPDRMAVGTDGAGKDGKADEWVMAGMIGGTGILTIAVRHRQQSCLGH